MLATLVSLDPVYLDFDMSEADFQSFSQYRGDTKGPIANRVELAAGDSTTYTRQGTLDFVDNVLDRSSGTIHARATVSNADLRFIPGEFSRVRLAVAHPAPTLLVPDASVLPDQSEYLVMTVSTDGTVVAKHVEVGEIRGVARDPLGPVSGRSRDRRRFALCGARNESGDARWCDPL